MGRLRRGRSYTGSDDWNEIAFRVVSSNSAEQHRTEQSYTSERGQSEASIMEASPVKPVEHALKSVAQFIDWDLSRGSFDRVVARRRDDQRQQQNRGANRKLLDRPRPQDSGENN
jgi:hypothetical protein